MNTLSVIVLSYTLDDEVYQMNCRCIESLLDSEQWQEGQLQVFLVESNKQNPYRYDDRVEVIVPEDKFNFHRFFSLPHSHSLIDDF